MRLIRTARLWSIGGGLALALAVAGSLAQAQGPGPGKASPPAGKEAAQGPDAALQRRVEQLEEQLVDLQVVIGTLESLTRGTSPPPTRMPPPTSNGGLGSADSGRLDAIETQIKALTSQLEHLQEQVRSLAERPSGRQPPRSGFGDVTVAPAAPPPPPPPPGPKDEIDRVFQPPKVEPPPRNDPPPRREAPATAKVEPPARDLGPKPPGGVGEDQPQPRQLYEQAYGFLLQKDYGAAEQSFDDFLKRHPTHHLAGNAQYWLGETFFVRGQYRPAAAAFLKGYKEYGSGQKAPESLLKLAMSLNRLGQKDAACSSFKELATKFPTPPAHVRSLAKTERQRAGC
jgi:tol-pal system protein YbgF